MSRVYLDHNATAPLRAEARAAMLAAMDVVGNPSSVHAEGRAAKAVVERARGQVAALVGCEPTQVVFTSGATEAANLVVAQSWDLVALAPTVHDCFANAVVPETDTNLKTHLVGMGDDAWQQAGHPLMAEWARCRRTLYVVSEGCGETGLLEDVARVVQVAEDMEQRANEACVGTPAHQVHVVSDVTQAVGRVARGRSDGVSYSVCSAHKLGGPKGVGALINYTRDDPTAILRGGGQEMGRRSGTENVIGIAGFGAAAEAAARDVADGACDLVEKLRNILENALDDASKKTIFVGKEAPRLPNTSCFITPGWKGETQVMQMDLAGFAISAGSACSSGKVKASRVLRAMGYSEVEAASAVRVSLGLETTEDDVLRFAESWAQKLKKHESRAA